jgi:anti-sigma-K factor RskA
MTHQDYKEMIPAHALAALDATEDGVLSSHLEECAECRRELDEWKETCAAVALDAKPLEPSPQLRQRILTQVRDDKTSTAKSNVVPLARQQRNVWSSLGTLGAIAASLLFLALLVYVVLLWREKQAIQSELATLRAEVTRTKKELDEQTETRSNVREAWHSFRRADSNADSSNCNRKTRLRFNWPCHDHDEWTTCPTRRQSLSTLVHRRRKADAW